MDTTVPLRRSVWIAVRLLRNAHRVRIPGGPDDWVDLFFLPGWIDPCTPEVILHPVFSVAGVPDCAEIVFKT